MRQYCAGTSLFYFRVKISCTCKIYQVLMVFFLLAHTTLMADFFFARRFLLPTLLTDDEMEERGRGAESSFSLGYAACR